MARDRLDSRSFRRMADPRRRELPFGSWPSAITAERILAGALRLGHPQIDRGSVYWLEGRPAEAGRQVVVRADRALVNSLNTPAVKTILHGGVRNTVQVLKEEGLSRLVR